MNTFLLTKEEASEVYGKIPDTGKRQLMFTALAGLFGRGPNTPAHVRPLTEFQRPPFATSKAHQAMEDYKQQEALYHSKVDEHNALTTFDIRRVSLVTFRVCCV